MVKRDKFEPNEFEVVALMEKFAGRTFWGDERLELVEAIIALGFEVNTGIQKFRLTRFNSYLRDERLPYQIQSCQRVEKITSIDRTAGFYVKKF